ncbi:hypothetical protein CK203_101766 [Vitis vinifera]|uniref:Uncharacterized protein n=1 Tax=Vitis vinifera TaxID=29760 RepID=A0A438FBT2_VITVI|nr:hypothetical protein CK203_101766 [Vitis vinifera]
MMPPRALNPKSQNPPKIWTQNTFAANDNVEVVGRRAGRLRTAVSNPRSLYLSSSPPAAAYHTIQAISREFTGSKVSARDRAQGRIPAVVFAQQLLTGGNINGRSVSRKRLLTTERKQIQAILQVVEPEFICSTTFPLQIRAGSGSSVLLESGTVLLSRDEATGKVLNLVFAWADEGSELKVDVPLVFKGEDVCPGLKKGWFFAFLVLPLVTPVFVYGSVVLCSNAVQLRSEAS